MLRRKSRFGGEKSGHLIFRDYSNSGDGTLAALQILSIIINKERNLHELSKILDLFPQLLINIKVRNKVPFNKIPKLDKLIRSSQKLLGNNGRINIRYSGTEALARVMIEGEDEKIINDVAHNISNIIERHIGL